MSLETARSPRLPTVCPFVAFDDERDLRSAVPDRRHRCYAVAEPEPRALAHQERYCLSPTFTSCPIFQDWAAREAAHVAPGEEAVGPVAASAAAAGVAGTGVAPSGRPGLFDEAPASLPAERAAAPSRSAWASERHVEDRFEDDGGEVAAGAGAASAAAAEREWDRPRRRRDYPALGRRGTPPLLAAIVVLAIAALALFFLPSVLRGLLGGAGTAASPTASAGVSGSPAASATGSAAASGGVVPSATPLVYIIQSGDNLTKIATKFNTTVNAILAANPAIKNANSIQKGQQIIIPTLGAPVPTASPSP